MSSWAFFFRSFLGHWGKKSQEIVFLFVWKTFQVNFVPVSSGCHSRCLQTQRLWRYCLFSVCCGCLFCQDILFATFLDVSFQVKFIEDIAWSRGETKLLFECGKKFRRECSERVKYFRLKCVSQSEMAAKVWNALKSAINTRGTSSNPRGWNTT